MKGLCLKLAATLNTVKWHVQFILNPVLVLRQTAAVKRS